MAYTQFYKVACLFFLAQYLAFILRQLWRLFVFIFLLWLFLLVLLTTLFLRLPDLADDASVYLSQWLGQTVSVGRLDGYWQHGLPILLLTDVKVFSPEQTPWLSLSQAEITIDLITSLQQQQVITEKISLTDGVLHWQQAAAESKPAVWHWLLQQKHFALHSSQLIWPTAAGRGFNLSDIHAHIYQENQQHIIKASVYLPQTTTDLPWLSPMQIKGGGVHFSGVSVWQTQSLQQVDGTLQWDSLQFKQQQHRFVLPAKTIGLHLQRTQAEKLHLRLLDMDERKNNIDFHLLANTLEQLDLYWQDISLQSIVSADVFSAHMPATLAKIFKQLKIKADLRNIRVQYSPKSDWTLAADIHNAQQQAWKNIPKINNLSGKLQLKADSGLLILNSPDLRLGLPNLYRRDFLLQQLTGRITWQRQGKQWQVQAENCQLQWDNHRLSLNSQWQIKPQQPIEIKEFNVEVKHLDLRQWHDFLPDKWLNAKQYAYYQQLFSQGTATGFFQFQGSLPWSKAHRWQAQLNLDQATLRYDEKWPKISHIQAQLHLNQTKVTAQLQQVDVEGQTIHNTDLTVADVSHVSPRLKINIHDKIQADKGLRFVHNSPLHDRLDFDRYGLALGGLLDLRLNLDIPLSHQPNKVKGKIQFLDNTLTHQATGLLVTAIDGSLRFTEQDFIADHLTARFGQQPVEFSIKTEQDNPVLLFSSVLNKTLFNQLNQQFSLKLDDALLHRLRGQAAFNGRLALKQDSPAMQLKLYSDLRGLALDLPQPLGKTTHPMQDLNLNADFGNAPSWRLSYGDKLQARFQPNTAGVWHKQLHFGRNPMPAPHDKNWSISGQIPYVFVNDWLPLLPRQMTAQPHGEAVSWQLNLNIPVLDAGSYRLQQLRLRAYSQDNDENQWHVHLNSRDVVGNIEYHPASNRLWIDLDKLWLLHKNPRKKKSPQPKISHTQPPFDLRLLPDTTFQAASVKINRLNLGQVSIEQNSNSQAVQFKTIESHSPALQLQAQGQWRQKDGLWYSQFEGRIFSNDIQAALADWGYQNQGIQSQQTQIDFDLMWPHHVHQFSLADMEASLTLAVGKGQLLQVNPGLGRLLGLFDWQTIPRRLILDFSDLFSQGLQFDAIDGKVFIKQGKAYTDALQLRSPLAQVVIAGRTGLLDKTYQQKMSITPHLTRSLPMAAALFGGVGLGAAVLVAQQALKNPLEQTFSRQYKITGSWQNPQVDNIPLQTDKPLYQWNDQ